MEKTQIPVSAMKRLPIYLHYLKSLGKDDKATISSAAIAEALGLGEVQVRKDLALVSGAGKPKIGYYLTELSEHIETALGVKNETTNVVVVGAGGRITVDVDPIPIAVAKEQSIVIWVFLATYSLWLV